MPSLPTATVRSSSLCIASMGMYLLCKKIRETTDVRVLLTGEISDELEQNTASDFWPFPTYGELLFA